jgi:hypothetical protein
MVGLRSLNMEKNKMYAIENETEEDITARMLRRIPIEELEEKANAQGIFTVLNESYNLDKDFLYTHGYTVEEYFEAAMGYRASRAVKQIGDAVRNNYNRRLKHDK